MVYFNYKTSKFHLDKKKLHCILSKEIPKIKCLNNFLVLPTINKYIFCTYLYYHMLKVNI